MKPPGPQPSAFSLDPSALGQEPVAGSATVPIWLVAVLGLVFYWAQLEVDKNAGRFSAGVYGPFSNDREVALANPKPNVDPRYEMGSIIYVKYCSPCHQGTGLGLPGQFPPLVKSDWVNTSGPDRLIRLVLHGIQGPIKVNGVDFNNAMVPWKDTLKDEEIAAVLTFVRGNKDWGNGAAPVTPERVAEIRKAEAGRDGPWSADELLKVPEGNP